MRGRGLSHRCSGIACTHFTLWHDIKYNIRPITQTFGTLYTSWFLVQIILICMYKIYIYRKDRQKLRTKCMRYHYPRIPSSIHNYHPLHIPSMWSKSKFPSTKTSSSRSSTIPIHLKPSKNLPLREISDTFYGIRIILLSKNESLKDFMLASCD